jgi:hypothetical protein
MNASVGILTFGSLIDSPGAEIEAALVGRILNVSTPFGVEFAALVRDGITYLIDMKRNGITTPLSVDYEQEILHRTQTPNLHEALRKIQTNA